MVIAGIVTLAAAGMHPAVRLARRFLETHVPASVLAEASAHEVESAPVGPPGVEQPAEPGGMSPLDGLPESTGDLTR